MKKCIILCLIIISALILSCRVDNGDPEVGGAYLMITTTGYYYDEVTGETSSKEETLTTIVNLYPAESYKNSRYSSSGYFQTAGSSGIVTQVSPKFNIGDNIKVFGGSAHLNGFIAKGPMAEGTQVSVKLLDENFEEIEIDENLLNNFEYTAQVDGLSEFDMELPATEDVEININANALTTMETERVLETMQQNKNRSRADITELFSSAQEDILSAFGLSGLVDGLSGFENLRIDQEGEANALLLIVSSILSMNSDMIDTIKEEIRTHGEILNEEVYDAIKDGMMNMDIDQVKTNLQNHFQAQGASSISIPDASPFHDPDGDGVPQQFEFSLLSPIGYIMPSFPNPEPIVLDWEDVNIPGVEYIVEFCPNKAFIPSQTISETLTTSQRQLTPEEMQKINPGMTYYWRVKLKVGDKIVGIPSATAFSITTEDTAPEGYISSLNASQPTATATVPTTATRVFIVDNMEIIGASEMRFSNDGNFDTPVEDWKPFELTHFWLLEPGNGEKTIYAEYKNDYGVYSLEYSVVLDNTVAPVGSIKINNDTAKTNNLNVKCFLNDSSNAFLVRLSNDGTFDAPEEQWRHFRPIMDWTLADTGEGDRTVYAEFKNQANTDSAQDTITFSTSTTPEGIFTINGGEDVTHRPQVMLDCMGIQMADEMRFSNDGGSTWSEWVAFSPSYAWNLGTNLTDGFYTVTAQFKNNNTGVHETSDQIQYVSVKMLNLTIGDAVTLTINGKVYDNSQLPKHHIPFPNGTTVEISVTPVDNHVFYAWKGTNGGEVTYISENSYEIIMNDHKQIEAYTLHGKFVSNIGYDTDPGTPDAPYLTITKAITEAQASGLKNVYVKEGSYGETLFLQYPVSIFGGYSTSTGSWADRNIASYTTTIQSDADPVMITVNDTSGEPITPETFIEGFTISNTSSGEKGIDVVSGSPTIKMNDIQVDNYTPTSGIGIEVSQGSHPEIIKNNIECGTYSTPNYGIFTRSTCVIGGNEIDGGGDMGSSGYGIAVYESGNSSMIANNVIKGGTNAIATGIVINNSATPKIYNNTVIGGDGNSNVYAIEIYNGASPEIINNLLFIGPASTSASIIYVNGAWPSIIKNNNIFKMGESTGTYNQFWNGNINVDEGSGNICTDMDGMFVNPIANDFHLILSTPANIYEGGIDLSSEGIVVDKDGNPRTAPFTMGAYELDQ